MQLGSAGDALTSSAANFPWCHQAFWVGDQTHLLILMWLVIWIYWVFFWVQTLPAFLEQMAFSRFYLCASGSSKMVPSSLCPVFFQVMGKLMETEHISAFNPRLLAKGVAHTSSAPCSCKFPASFPSIIPPQRPESTLVPISSEWPLSLLWFPLPFLSPYQLAWCKQPAAGPPPIIPPAQMQLLRACKTAAWCLLHNPPFHPPWPPSLFPHQPGCPPFSWASPKVWWPKPKLGNISPFTQLSASAVMWEHSSSSPATSCWQPSRMTMTQ